MGGRLGSLGRADAARGSTLRSRDWQPRRYCVQVVADRVTQRLECPMAVVAGHVGVEVLPETLDAIVVRTVGRKEVELEAT